MLENYTLRGSGTVMRVAGVIGIWGFGRYSKSMARVNPKNLFTAFIVLSIITGLFLIGHSPPAMAEEGAGRDEILVLGTSRIVGGNAASAKQAALSEALRKGVEEYLARRLGSRGLVNNFPRIIHDVLPRAKEQVENFHILAEEKTDRYCTILVRVKINEKLMDEKLREVGLIMVEGPPIKILFLVSQVYPEQGQGTYWWMDPDSIAALSETELTLFRIFQERGFSPINRMSYSPEGDFPMEMRAPELSTDAVVNWGKAFSADVAVYGICNISESQGVSIALTAIDVAGGAVIADTNQVEPNAPGGGDQAVQAAMARAVGRAAAEMSPGILGSRQSAEKKYNAFPVVIMGIKNFRQYKAFRDFLSRGIPGVISVQQKKIRGNTLFLSVEYDGDSDGLIDMISNHADRPFPLDIMKNEEGQILINIR